MKTYTRLALASLIAVGAASTAARADIVTALAATPTLQSDGTYAYTYNVQLAGSSQLIGTATNDSTDTLAGNRQFGTVYDFGPMIQTDAGVKFSDTGLLAGFNFTFNKSDATGPGAVDDPTLNNIRFTYAQTNSLIYIDGQTPSPPAMTATAQTVDGTDVANLGTFTVYSALGPTLNNGLYYDGASFKSTNDTLQTNAGFVSGPQQPGTAVPEPASLALLGAGLVGLGFIRRRNANAV